MNNNCIAQRRLLELLADVICVGARFLHDYDMYIYIYFIAVTRHYASSVWRMQIFVAN